MIKQNMMMSMHPHFADPSAMPYIINQGDIDYHENYMMSLRNQDQKRKSWKVGPGNKMDLLKKFRYNFHYWLKNCYQNNPSGKSPQQIKDEQQKEIYKTTQPVQTAS